MTRVGQKVHEDAPELREQFSQDMTILSKKNDLIINMDETPKYFDMPSNKTIDFKGMKIVTMKTTGREKLRYTVVLTAGVHKIQYSWRFPFAPRACEVNRRI